MQGVGDMGNNMAMEGNNRQLDGHNMTIGAILMDHFSRFNPICHPYLLIPVVVTDPHNMLILKLHPPNQPSHHEGSNVDFMIWLHHYLLMVMDNICSHLLDKGKGKHRQTTTTSPLLLNIHISIRLRMIEDAEEKGVITPGITTLVGPTSGNLGIAFAYIASQKGYKFIAVMPDHYSIERRIILKCLGADIELTDSELGMQGVIQKLDQLTLDIPNVHVLDQLSNPANPEAHFMGTGPEIWKDTAGKVDIFICGSGSGGTLSGAGRYLRSQIPSIKIICVEPAESPVISGGTPGSHDIQGIGPGIIPHNLDMSLIDEIITVSTEEAMVHARRLAVEEGLLVGISSGANLAACLKVAKRAENKGKMIVTVFASCGERYLSTELFSQVREECMNMKF